jgi:uncharacterized protein (DUF2141 family)
MIKAKYYSLYFGYIIVISTSAYPGQCSGELIVDVHGAKAQTGNAIASVFSSPENYLKAPISEQSKAVNEVGRAQFIFRGLKEGEYAISVIYDEDSNGKLNTGFLGIPKEKIGFSNNAKSTFGPPSFDEVSFMYTDSTTITINLDDAER